MGCDEKGVTRIEETNTKRWRRRKRSGWSRTTRRISRESRRSKHGTSENVEQIWERVHTKQGQHPQERQ